MTEIVPNVIQMHAYDISAGTFYGRILLFAHDSMATQSDSELSIEIAMSEEQAVHLCDSITRAVRDNKKLWPKSKEFKWPRQTLEEARKFADMEEIELQVARRQEI